MNTDHYAGFWVEWRGKFWHGFCDQACKAKFVRKQKWAIINAMEAHCREAHGGQTTIDYVEPPLLANGFPF